MKILALALLGLFLTTTAPAFATPISKDMANKYYESCAANTDPNFTKEVQELFCACTAAQLVDSFTVEDMQATSQQNQAGRNATNKLITEIYSPCIQYPAKQYHYNSCIANPKTKMLGNAEKICNCSADLVASHLQKNAKSLFKDILRKNPNIGDPMQALYDDPKFQSFAQSKIMGCVR